MVFFIVCSIFLEISVRRRISYMTAFLSKDVLDTQILITYFKLKGTQRAGADELNHLPCPYSCASKKARQKPGLFNKGLERFQGSLRRVSLTDAAIYQSFRARYRDTSWKDPTEFERRCSDFWTSS